MNKVLFDANFKDDILWKQMHSCLFAAVMKIAPEYKFFGLSNENTEKIFSKNVHIKTAEFCCNDNIWHNLILPMACVFNKNVPIYFPNAWISGFLPHSTPVITSIKDISFIEQNNKNLRRKLQTDINRSDLIFVPTQYAKEQLTKEFSLEESPVVLNFASLISDEYLDLPLSVNSERYFFVEAQNVSSEGLNALLKIFIYMHSKNKNNAKLYLVGDFDINTQELLVNLEVARKLNIVREYDNLSSGQRASLMKGAIAAILPSKQDNLPIAHLDAMKCSCPVLTEKTPSVYEVCEDAVLYSDIDNMAEYCEILAKLEQDENYRKNYIYSGLYREKSYSWDKSAQEFLQNLEQLLV